MKILFIGGTGLISSAVTESLLRSGHEVFLLNRGSNRRYEALGAKYLIGDIRDEKAVQELLHGLVFDAVADWIAYTPDDIERDFRLFDGRTKQYIFISSASAYSKPITSYPITESNPLGNRYWDYAQNKADAEEALFRHFREDGFPATVVRPSHTYGRDKLLVPLSGAKTQWTYAARMLAGKPTVVHGDGRSLWTVTHNTDFAKAFCGLVGNMQAVGHAFHITSDEALSWDRIIEIECEILGVEPNILHVPSDYIARKLPEYRGGLLGDKAESMVFDTTKIKRFVPSFICTVPFSIGARMSVEALLCGDRLVDEAYDAKIDAFCDDYIKRFGD